MRKILIRRIDIKRWKKVGKRVIVYGRRKVGKSFFIKNFTKWDEYFLVKRDGGIIDLKTGKEISYDYLKDLILKEKKKRIVIDEFHRLPDDFLDFLQAFAEDLNLVLLTSTLWFAERILSKGSPILGLFQRFKMEIIDERDVILGLSDSFRGKELIEASVYLREPWLIPMVNGRIREEIPRILWEEKDTIERLLGEIFREEDRRLKKSYLSILGCISNSKRKSSEIASFLYSRKIIERQDPSIIQGYLKTLVNIGLLEKMKVWNKRFDLYYHKSPIFDLYFYLDSKYGFSELDIPLSFVKKVFEELLPHHVEQFFRGFFSKMFGMLPGKILERDYDIDIALVEFQKLKVVGEVKWKNEIDKSELRKVEEKLNKFKGCRKILVVPEKEILPYEPEVEVWDVEKILNALQKQFTL